MASSSRRGVKRPTNWSDRVSLLPPPPLIMNQVNHSRTPNKQFVGSEGPFKCQEPCSKLYSPKNRSDLLTSNSTLLKLENWLRSSTSKENRVHGRVLVICGPSGSGKTSTLTILANELRLKVLEFTPEETNIEEIMHRKSEGQFTNISRTLADVTSFFSSARKKFATADNVLLIMKDLPDLFLRDPLYFHKALHAGYSHLKTHRSSDTSNFRDPIPPLVIVFTTGSASNSALEDSFGGTLTLERLLPSRIQAEFAMDIIRFSPLKTSLTKEIKLLAKGRLSPREVDLLVSISSGDVRHALITLEFILRSDTRSGNKHRSSGSSNTGKRRRAEMYETTPSASLAIMGRELGGDFYHSLGKILHAKQQVVEKEERMILDDDDFRSSRPTSSPSDKSSSDGPKYSFLLKDHPVEIVHQLEKCFTFSSFDTSHYSMMDFLFEHYPHYVDTLDAASEIAAKFSEADSIHLDLSEKRLLQSYRSLLTSAAHMYYSSLEKRTGGCSVESRPWRPLHKPKYSTLADAIIAFRQETNATTTGYYGRTISTREVIMDYAPFLGRLGHSPLPAYVSPSLASYLSWMSTYRDEYSAASNPVYGSRQAKFYSYCRNEHTEEEEDDSVTDALSLKVQLTEEDMQELRIEEPQEDFS